MEAHDRRHAHGEKCDELHVGKLHRPQLGVRLLGDNEVGRAHKAEQQPTHEQVRVNGARGVERNPLVQDIQPDVGKAHDESIDELQNEQQHRGGEEPVGDFLRGEFHERDWLIAKR